MVMPGKKSSTCLKQSIVLGTPTYADGLKLRRQSSEEVGDPRYSAPTQCGDAPHCTRQLIKRRLLDAQIHSGSRDKQSPENC